MGDPTTDALRRYRELATADLQSPDGDPDRTLDLIVRFVGRVLPADGGASIVLWDAERDAFTTSASTIVGQPTAHAARRVREEGATRAIVRTRRPVIVPDVTHDPFGANAMLGEHGLAAYVGVPLIADQRTLGVMYAMDHTPREWTQDEVGFLRAVALRAALAISKAQADRLEELSMQRAQSLYAMSRHLLEAANLEELAERLVDGLAVGLDAEAVVLAGASGVREGLPERTVAGPAGEVLQDVPVERLTGVSDGRLWDLAGPLERGHGVLTDLRERLTAEHYLLTPLAAHGVVHGVLVIAAGTDQPAFTARDAGFVQAMANLVTVAIENLALMRELHRRATTDALTGIHNRRHLMDLGEQLFAVARRTGEPISVLMLDIDHFKRVNDEHGHAVGDEVLQRVATLLLVSLRSADVLGRYGGEEFAAILPNTSAAVAQEVAERLRTAIADEPINTAAGPVETRVSIGGAVATQDDASLATLLDRADEQLYLAKRAGRDRVRFA